jgi:hypothetical protein
MTLVKLSIVTLARGFPYPGLPSPLPTPLMCHAHSRYDHAYMAAIYDLPRRGNFFPLSVVINDLTRK